MRLSAIAKALNLSFEGEDVELVAMNELSKATSDELSFAEHKKYATELQNSMASAFIIDESLLEYLPRNASYILSKHVSVDMALATKLFAPKVVDVHAPPPRIGKGSYIDAKAHIEKGAVIGANVTILAGAYIGSYAKIGDNTMIYPNVTIYRDCIVGKGCIIHAGTVIGSDGFGFSHTQTGEHIKIYQNGNVLIEDDVEIGANCAIDRAVFNSTTIKRGVKLDNFVHIGHNCEIGEYSLFVAQVGVGGSTKLGRNCVVSGPRIGKGSYIDAKAHIEKGAVIGANVTILAGAYIGSYAKIGDNTMIYPNVTIYRDCIVGKGCIIHAGTVIGSDGFGFSHTQTGEHIKIYQNGNVLIEDDVEIGANCAIDRAVFNSTTIKRGVKLDNFVHIGHNCEIGEYSLFVAQVGVGGSTKLGRNCVVSGQTAFSDHLQIAPFTTFTARSGVTKSIKEPHKVFSGYPLMEHKQWRRLQRNIAKLSE